MKYNNCYPPSESGWLTTDGEFYFVPAEFHDGGTKYIFNKTVREVEEMGFIRIYSSENWIMSFNKTPNQIQYDFLEKNGYNPNEKNQPELGLWNKARKYFNNIFIVLLLLNGGSSLYMTRCIEI